MKSLPAILSLVAAAALASTAVAAPRVRSRAHEPAAVPPLFSVDVPGNPDLAASVVAYLAEHSSIPAAPAPAPDAPFALRFESFPASEADYFVDPDSPDARVVNLARLADPDESPAPDVYARRAGQLALCAAVSCFGLEPCPFPLCVHLAHRRPSTLDSMSRNLCPPCRDRLISAANAKGLALIPAIPAASAAPAR